MNQEAITSLVAVRYFEKNKPKAYWSWDKKQTELLVDIDSTTKKTKLQNIPEHAELQMTSTMPFFDRIEKFDDEKVTSLNTWAYDNGEEDLGLYPRNFLHKADGMIDLSEPAEAAVPLLRQVKQKMISVAMNRILKVEKFNIAQPRTSMKSKILSLVTSNINPSIKKSAAKYITDKIQTRLNMGLDWLCREYSIYRGFHDDTSENEENMPYKTLFCILSTAIIEFEGEERGALMSKLFNEAPAIPDEAVECWKNIIPDERGLAVIELLHKVMMEKPGKLRKLLNVLLHYSKHEIAIIRKGSVNMSLDFYNNSIFTKIIEDFAFLHVEYLRLLVPPPGLFSKDQGREKEETVWTDSTVRACLALYIGLVQKCPHFILKLEELFQFMHPHVKRIVLKHIRIPLQTFNVITPLLDRAHIEKYLKLF